MPHVSAEFRSVAFKIVYAGPGFSGKTTNLLRVHTALDPELRGEMLTLDTVQERTLFFDFFALDLGSFEGFSIKFNMYTVPGQVIYAASRRIILEGADGIVFVADSAPDRLDENFESWRDMAEALQSYGVSMSDVPTVLQYNKRDHPQAIPMGTLEGRLGIDGIPVIGAVATEGRGVIETIRTATRMVVERFEG